MLCSYSLNPRSSTNFVFRFIFVICFKMQENKAFLPEGTSPETAYDGAQLNTMDMAPTTSKWNPRGWQKKWKVTAVVATIIAIIVIIVAAVEGTKHHKSKNSYPDYHALNYTLEDRWQGTNFFDNFDYHSTADPANGFVKYATRRVLARSSTNMYAATWIKLPPSPLT